MNLAESGSASSNDKIHRGTFGSVQDLDDQDPCLHPPPGTTESNPFAWTKTADQILKKELVLGGFVHQVDARREHCCYRSLTHVQSAEGWH